MLRAVVCLILFIPLTCCVTPAASPSPDDTTAADVPDVVAVEIEAPDIVVDIPPVDTGDTECTQACTILATCDGLSWDVCMKKCTGGDPCDRTCVTDNKKCEDVADCLGVWNPKGKFDESTPGVGWRTLAGDFNLTTDDAGDWSLQNQWNGRDNYVFLFTAVDFKYAAEMWKSNIKTWLVASPKNVHYFFMYYDQKGDPAAQKLLTDFEAVFGKALGKLDAVSQCQWKRRVHFVAEPLSSAQGALAGLINNVKGVAALGIDRQQNWRQIGLLQTVGGSPDLKQVTFDVRHWNYNFQRDIDLAKQTVTLVPVHAAKDGAGFDVEIDFPPASEMKKYDTMEVDLGAWCKDHKDENCSEWDYISYARLCERQTGPNADATTKCQPYVAEAVEVTETLGLCKDATSTCKADLDCGKDIKCAGYVAPVKAAKGMVADTKTCNCNGLSGESLERKRVCKADGSGFGDCECGCPLEIARWITPYHREGRWISDISESLAYIGKGGKQRIAFDAANFPMIDFTIRLSNRKVGVKPVKMVELFSPGGGFNQNYNNPYKPMTINIPASTKKIELYAIITGHGFGTDTENCAEFCNHEHHFTVNGSEHVKNQPVAGQFWGCADQIEQGALPNQFGTWTLGRGGWCPGMDVKPYRVDVTKDAKIGADNIIGYQGLFKGKTFVPVAQDGKNGGFGANINLRSWLVFYE